MRIVFFSPDYSVRGDTPMPGGAAYYRCILPAKELAKHGHETYFSPTCIVHQETGYLTGQTQSFEIPDPDVFVIHSWPEDGVESILRARRAGQIVIGDIDDLIWDLPDGHQAEGLNTLEKNRGNMWRNFMACDALTVSTPYLKEWLENFAHQNKTTPFGQTITRPSIHVVRNAIDLDAFTYNSMRDKVRVIGWSGNPLWRADDLSVLAGWLGDFLERHDLRFLHVGALPHQSIADQLGINPKRLIERSFQTFSEYRPSNPLREMDIQLIPLLDCTFNRAKSALKGLESAAWGIPFAYSNLPEYGDTWGSIPSDVVLNQQCEMLLARYPRQCARKFQLKQTELESITSRWRDWEKVYCEVAEAS